MKKEIGIRGWLMFWTIYLFFMPFVFSFFYITDFLVIFAFNITFVVILFIALIILFFIKSKYFPLASSLFLILIQQVVERFLELFFLALRCLISRFLKMPFFYTYASRVINFVFTGNLYEANFIDF